MNTNKNFEKINSENLMKIAGGILPGYNTQGIEEIQKQIEEAERKEKERKMAEKMVATGIHGNPPIER